MTEKEIAKRIIHQLDQSPLSARVQDGLAQARYRAVERASLVDKKELIKEELLIISAGAGTVGAAMGFNGDKNGRQGKENNIKFWLLALLIIFVTSFYNYSLKTEIQKFNDDDLNVELQLGAQSFSGMIDNVDVVMDSAP